MTERTHFDKAREILDAWDLKHWGRKPIADNSFQYRSREDLIQMINDFLRDIVKDKDDALREMTKELNEARKELSELEDDREKHFHECLDRDNALESSQARESVLREALELIAKPNLTLHDSNGLYRQEIAEKALKALDAQSSEKLNKEKE